MVASSSVIVRLPLAGDVVFVICAEREVPASLQYPRVNVPLFEALATKLPLIATVLPAKSALFPMIMSPHIQALVLVVVARIPVSIFDKVVPL